MHFYQFNLTALNGTPLPLEQFKGKKVVILNTASECGYTPQYAAWQRFYAEHHQQVVVLGVPANNFGAQEPGSNEEIAGFCTKNYGVTFPLTEKLSVIGEDQHPLYRWLSSAGLNGWNNNAPDWNFCKYLVNEQGELTHFFNSDTTPNSPEFRAALQSQS